MEQKLTLYDVLQYNENIFLIDEFLEQFTDDYFPKLISVLKTNLNLYSRVVTKDKLWFFLFNNFYLKRINKFIINQINDSTEYTPESLKFYMNKFNHITNKIIIDNQIVVKSWYQIYCSLRKKYNILSFKDVPKNYSLLSDDGTKIQGKLGDDLEIKILNHMKLEEQNIHNEVYFSDFIIYKQYVDMLRHRTFILDIFGNFIFKKINYNPETSMIDSSIRIMATQIKDIFMTEWISGNRYYYIIFLVDFENNSYFYTKDSYELHTLVPDNVPILIRDNYLALGMIPLKYKIKDVHFGINYISIITIDGHSFRIYSDSLFRGIGMLEDFLRINDVSNFIDPHPTDININKYIDYNGSNISLNSSPDAEVIKLKFDLYEEKLSLQLTHQIPDKIDKFGNVSSYKSIFKNYIIPKPKLLEGEKIIDMEFNKSEYIVKFNSPNSPNFFLEDILYVQTSIQLDRVLKSLHGNKIFLLDCNFIPECENNENNYDEQEIYDLTLQKISLLEYIFLDNIVKIKFKIINYDYYIVILDNLGNLYIHHKSHDNNIGKEETKKYLNIICNYKETFMLLVTSVSNFHICSQNIIVERDMLQEKE